MYLPIAVKVPVIKGKIVQRTKGKSTYVLYEIGREYDAKRQFNVPNRVVIGKLVPTGNQDTMNPNENFLKYFPQIPVNRGVSGFLCLGRLFQGQPNEAALCI